MHQSTAYVDSQSEPTAAVTARFDSVAGGSGWDALTKRVFPHIRSGPAEPRRGDGPLARVLGAGAMPYLCVLDAVMLLVAVRLVGGSAVMTVGSASLDLILLAGGGLYWSRLTLSVLDDLPAIVGRILVGSACVAVLAAQVGDHPSAVRDVLLVAMFGSLLVALGRAVAYQAIRTARRLGAVQHNALVLGAGEVGGQLARTLLEHPEYGLKPVGFVDNEPYLVRGDRPVPLVGSVASLADVVRGLDVRVVLLAYSRLTSRHLVEIVRTCDRLNCEIFFVPRLFELHFRSREMDSVWGLPLVRLRRPAFRLAARLSKRLLDVAVSTLALVVVAPLMALCALAILVTSGRPVLYRQERVGLDGHIFRVAKFRSYTRLVDPDVDARWGVGDEKGITTVGRWLRRTSLDELPQLWNVLTGDMTLVGPRPERPHFVQQFTAVYPHYVARHRVPAGLTGWAQVHGLRGDTSVGDRAAFDNYYIENYSAWNDVKILLRTAAALSRNAR